MIQLLSVQGVQTGMLVICLIILCSLHLANFVRFAIEEISESPEVFNYKAHLISANHPGSWQTNFLDSLTSVTTFTRQINIFTHVRCFGLKEYV